MSYIKYLVPEGMLQAGRSVYIGYATAEEGTRVILEAALRWQSENPIVPTAAQVKEMKLKLVPVHPHWANIVAEWQRRMYLAPEPEVPEAIKDLLLNEDAPEFSRPTRRFFNTNLVEAFQRGKKAAVKA